MRTVAMAVALLLACCGSEPVAPTDGGHDEDGGQVTVMTPEEFCPLFVDALCERRRVCWGKQAYDSCRSDMPLVCPTLWTCVDTVDLADECLAALRIADCAGPIAPESCGSPCE